MKGIRFYEEFINKNKKGQRSREVVIAKIVDTGHYVGGHTFIDSDGEERTLPAIYVYDCFASIYDGPNMPVCSGSAHEDYFRKHCKRISEEKARVIHPKLFERLDE